MTNCGNCTFWHDYSKDWGVCHNDKSDFYKRKTDRMHRCIDGAEETNETEEELPF